jgi:hypothetical protein
MRSLLIVAIGLAGMPAWADEERERIDVPAHLSSLSDAEIDERQQYLEHRLDDGRLYASLWWKGWTGFYALGVGVQSTRAAIESEDGKQADLVVSAVKALGGTINLLRHPLAWTDGADPVRELPNATREDRLARLAFAEQTLRANAEGSDRRYGWKSHVANILINAAGAGIVHGGWGDRTRAWRSAGVGIAVGEIMLFSHPWWYRDAYDEYEQRFSPSAAGTRVSWRVLPTIGGVTVQAEF